jgi:hypothetical protein
MPMVNYRATMRRARVHRTDMSGDGSDDLVDWIVAHGDAGTVAAAAVQAHLDGGADHVCVQIQPAQSDIIPALRAIPANSS